MPIDPTRLARIRVRVLAAATLAIPACAGQRHVNDRPPDDTHINRAPPNPDANAKPIDGPINEHVADQPPASPEPKHINTPPPDEPHVNRPPPDRNPK